MSKMNFDHDYWKSKYLDGSTGWDAGSITRPIKAYIDQLRNRELNILVPGSGRGHEAIYLMEQGFHNTWALDLVQEPLDSIQERCPLFPNSQLICGDFFAMKGEFDLILEQTFFCALHPGQRPEYVKQASRLLRPGGRVAGVFFDFELTDVGPPFGGSALEYEMLFNPYFHIHSLERCHNSIAPRQNRELFCIFTKK